MKVEIRDETGTIYKLSLSEFEPTLVRITYNEDPIKTIDYWLIPRTLRTLEI